MTPNTSGHELIRNSIARYCLGIDREDWTILSQAFAEDVKIAFPEPIGLVEGISSVIEKVQSMVGTLQTQHALSTQIIELTSEKTATATTYGRTVHFGTGPHEGKEVTAWGTCHDKLVKGQFDGCENWRIMESQVMLQAPFRGDLSLIPM